MNLKPLFFSIANPALFRYNHVVLCQIHVNYVKTEELQCFHLFICSVRQLWLS